MPHRGEEGYQKAVDEIRRKLDSSEWVAMYSYYSGFGCNWVTVYGTPEQLQEIQDAGGFAPPLRWCYGYPPARRITNG